MARGIPVFVSDIRTNTRPEVLTQISLSGNDAFVFKEDYLQSLIDDAPQILPVRDFYPTVTSLCSLGREIPVDLGSKQGYIDNLFVTNDAHLVLVETKLYRNPEGIREVVAQTYQYGEAINAMSLMKLEECLRRGYRTENTLKVGETIRSRIQTLSREGNFPDVVEDFEDRLSNYIRTGEILYLIVADGIRASVERMTFWLNEISGSAPYKFGLIELRFYKSADGKSVVIPKTLLRTKEISRHVVVVNIHGGDASVSAVVNEQTQTESGGISTSPRPIKFAGPALTKDKLLAASKDSSASAFVVVSELLDGLESLGLDSNAKASTLQYGLRYPREDGYFYPLVSLEVNKSYSQLPSKLVTYIGDSAFVEYKRALNSLAPFFHPMEVDDPAKKLNSRMVPYEALAGKVEKFVDAIAAIRDKALVALSQES